MLRKTRSTIAMVIAASSFAFAVGPLAPVASAAINRGGFQQTQAAKPARQSPCEIAEAAYENALTLAEYDGSDAHYNEANLTQDLKLANGIAAHMRAMGC